MRDVGLILFFLACVPKMLQRPWLGVVMWVWLSVMNPHRLAWGFAYDLQFAAATVAITTIGLLLTKDDRRLPMTAPVVALFAFTFWMCLTSIAPFHAGSGFDMWSRVMKIMLMVFFALALIHEKKQIEAIVWAIVVSLGFYGAKGGVFTLATGGKYIVWGPGSSFIEGNNELALALVMTIPMMRYVQMHLKKQWQKHTMTAVMLLTAFAAIGSHSRGALVAMSAMALFLWGKSRNKVVMAFMLTLSGVLLLSFMPTEWFTRMHTISNYGEDSSAMGRINAWWMAFHLACARPLGGGFEIYDFDTFSLYAPDPLNVHAAHSIYFQVLGEHGFVGLFLFLAIGLTTWRSAGEAKRLAKGVVGMEWIPLLMDMMKVSMIGYGVGGAFLSLAYFDVPYYVLAIVVATRVLVSRSQQVQPVRQRSDGFVRARHFGMVKIDEESAEPVGAPAARPGRDNWRGHRGYLRS